MALHSGISHLRTLYLEGSGIAQSHFERQSQDYDLAAICHQRPDYCNGCKLADIPKLLQTNTVQVVLIALEFLDYQLYQETLKGFIYAIKLKLELNILSRLVDLVDNKSTRKERSMTLDVIDSTAINGAPQSDGQQELSWPGGLNNPFERDEKVDLNNVEDGHKSKNSSSGSFTKGPDDGDEISRVLSNRSKTTARTKGRESDVMYADILRAMN